MTSRERFAASAMIVFVSLAMTSCGEMQDVPETTPVVLDIQADAGSNETGGSEEEVSETTESSAERHAPSFSGIAGDSAIDWEGCNPREMTEDWVGNEFYWTLCWTPSEDVVSFYEFGAEQAPGMKAEYTETAHISDTWGVAADSQILLNKIVANLAAAGW